MAVSVFALAASALILASAFAFAGFAPRARACWASAAALRASASVIAGHWPSVSLIDLPAYRYRTANDRAPDGCEIRNSPLAWSLISRRWAAGLRFSTNFAV